MSTVRFTVRRKGSKSSGSSLLDEGIQLAIRAVKDDLAYQRRITNIEEDNLNFQKNVVKQNTLELLGEQRRKNLRDLGAIRAATGASGFVTTEGSPLMAQLEQAMEGELELARIQRQGDLDIFGIDSSLEALKIEQERREAASSYRIDSIKQAAKRAYEAGSFPINPLLTIE